ncbi:acetyltransferase [Sediminibacterium sp.]|uniref:acetyltransferase n=1 Tax=Sediminibacterium sp. TaxID=1917865 RepID=UPI002730A32F|nr:acetyltransferase [Sediminibacterium sp.]MDP2420228.1 acetyltransferase [Sediminibacterium sp.]
MLENKFIIIGYSGHGFVVADAAIEKNLNIIGYAENIVALNNPFQLNFLGNENEKDFFLKYKGANYLIGIGNNTIREKIYNLILEKKGEVFTMVSQSASISKTAKIGNGTFVNRNVSINSLAQIGENVILNTGCIIEHECLIADSAHIAPGAVLAGNVKVGERSFIGANSVIKQGVIIGNDVIVGAGAVVINNIPDRKKIVGNPSRFV